MPHVCFLLSKVLREHIITAQKIEQLDVSNDKFFLNAFVQKNPQKTKDMQASYCNVALDFFSSIVFAFALIATSVKMSFLLQEEWTCCDFSSSLFTASSMS